MTSKTPNSLEEKALAHAQAEGLIWIGWREWVALPELGIDWIKAKIDTGAKTSALHVEDLVCHQRGEHTFVTFWIFPFQRKDKGKKKCHAKVIDERVVTDSGGHTEKRYVIETSVRIGSKEWPIELTLTDRGEMNFRMLLGRTAMREKVLINPHHSYLSRKRIKKK